jgi:hypothetical protein
MPRKSKMACPMIVWGRSWCNFFRGPHDLIGISALHSLREGSGDSIKRSLIEKIEISQKIKALCSRPTRK